MSEWDPERESYEPERDFRRDYLTPGLGYADRTPGRRREDYARGVWSIGGTPRQPQRGQVEPRGPMPSAGPGPHAGKGPRGYRRSDMVIYEEVCERLKRHPNIDASDVEVTVQEGEVTLEGTVSGRGVRRLAEDVAAATKGVRDVHNRLRVPDREKEEP